MMRMVPVPVVMPMVMVVPMMMGMRFFPIFSFAFGFQNNVNNFKCESDKSNGNKYHKA
ncbi:MAG: hypothetical protein N3F09_05000 [Bacteroidia bacterium]|nr:hypothetical protein [Bacteroidia bacterium]